MSAANARAMAIGECCIYPAIALMSIMLLEPDQKAIAGSLISVALIAASVAYMVVVGNDVASARVGEARGAATDSALWGRACRTPMLKRLSHE